MSLLNEEILLKFKENYKHLGQLGASIEGANIDSESNVIHITLPFVFDNRLLPDKFMNLGIRKTVYDLPREISHPNNEHKWAYQRYEAFVDKHFEEIQNTMQRPDMTRGEMLDALSGGDFEGHKKLCLESESKLGIAAEKLNLRGLENG